MRGLRLDFGRVLVVGLILDATREGPPWPVPTFIELTCDGDHGLFRAEPVRFDCDPWAATALSLATAAGWKITAGRALGPCCSGKTSA